MNLRVLVAISTLVACSSSGLKAEIEAEQANLVPSAPPTVGVDIPEGETEGDPAAPVPDSDPGPDPDPDPGPDPGPDPDPDPGPDPGTPTGVCFPGLDELWTLCFGTVEASQTGYAYPAPLSSQYAQPTRYLDLAALDPELWLAPNFQLVEIAEEFKGRYAVVQPHAIERLQALRDALGSLVVNSGYRPPDYNASVGGATSSRHLYGDGFDLAPQTASLSELENACYANNASYVQVYVSHVHCDWRYDPLEPAFYGTSSAPAFTYWEPLLDAEVLRQGDALSAPAEGWDEGEPLREWTAFDADGVVIETDTGDHYEPPESAASVEVWVGRRILRTVILD